MKGLRMLAIASGCVAALVAAPAQAVTKVSYRPYPPPVNWRYPPPDPTPTIRASLAGMLDADIALGDATNWQLVQALSANLRDLQAANAALAEAASGDPAIRALQPHLHRLVQLQQSGTRLTQAQAGLAGQLDQLHSQRDHLGAAPISLEVPATAVLNGRLATAVAASIQVAEGEAREQLRSSLPGRSQSPPQELIWPEAVGEVTQGFGPSDLQGEPPYQGFAHFHLGLDIGAEEGTPVLGADAGIVALTGTASELGPFRGYGNYIVVVHPGALETVYGHLDSILVGVGDRISRGQPIGLEGSTGYSTGPHLHFEVRSGETPLDPATFLPAGGPAPARV